MITIKSYDKTFVCFLDILGFKDLVENNTPEDLSKIYELALQNAVDQTTSFWKQSELKSGFSGVEINSIVISDSIIIWTSNHYAPAFVKMLMTVHGIMFQTIALGIPLRGAVCVGQLTILKSTNNTTAFGRSIVNAYKLESNQNWSGCIVDDECISVFEDSTKGLKNQIKLSDLYFLTRYQTPLKDGKIETHWVIDWTKIKSSLKIGQGMMIDDEEEIIKAFSMHQKNVNNWKVHSIILNTISFWNHIKEAELDEFLKKKLLAKKRKSKKNMALAKKQKKG